MPSIVIFGAGENAEVAHYYFSKHTNHDVVGFAVDDAYVKEGSLFSLPIIPSSRLLVEAPPSKHMMFVAIGYSDMNKNRSKAFFRMKELGYDCVSYISPHCNCFTDNIGENSFILEDNTIQPFVKIGRNTVLWSGNHIGHHSVIEDDCFITSHVVVSGGVRIGRGSFIGVNASIRDHIKIGDESMVGMGAIVTKDLPNCSIIRASRSEILEKTTDELK